MQAVPPAYPTPSMPAEYQFSAPPALVRQFGCIPGPGCFAAHDPLGRKLGSGGGTTHLIVQAWREFGQGRGFLEWFHAQRRIIVHAGGQSRRLPAYAAAGKALTPVPVFRWERGQRIGQTLADLQMPLFDAIMDKAPARLRWLVASGDALISAPPELPTVPEADVLCAGLWTEPQTALSHGVFFSPRGAPTELSFMLQKPALETLRELACTHHFQLDVGLWLLSDAAMLALMRRSGWDAENETYRDGGPGEYDLYGDFGPALGRQPTKPDPELSTLSAAILPLPGGRFHHFGSNRDLIRSSLALQNAVSDQRQVQMRHIKPHPDIFVQNAATDLPLTIENSCLWVENSHIGRGWTLRKRHIVTGVPRNDWAIDLPEGACLDIVPVGDKGYCVRPYGMDDAFRGAIGTERCLWMEAPAREWFARRGLDMTALGLDETCDIQDAAIFPLFEGGLPGGDFVRWMLDPTSAAVPNAAKGQYVNAKRLSANELGDCANLRRLFAQREGFLAASLPILAANSARSVFFQVDMDDMASLYAASGHALPQNAPDYATEALQYAQDRMFRARVLARRGQDASLYEEEAFAALRRCLVESVRARPVTPQSRCLGDQIIWGRSPVRFDIAGGWSDTPPYCLFKGGKVLNMALELNGQPPLQVFARLIPERHIVLRSIDLGVSTTLRSYEDISDYAQLDSGFAIPKAALALCGFLPAFAADPAATLAGQLDRFGAGMELTLLSAVPKGSGLGTSSILAATLLGVLSRLCDLGWDEVEICRRSLVLEQMLTSGGGWQDQYGGVLRGIKLLQTQPGLDQTPEIRHLPEHMFDSPENSACLLLYYTGITRIAKGILGEIVRGMFLNRRDTIATVDGIAREASQFHESIQRGRFADFGPLLARTWESKKRLDSGTNPPEVEQMLGRIADWTSGASLGGAGGGGFLLIAAKDPEAAARIRAELRNSPPNAKARFVGMSLSKSGLQVTES